jgi:hypothetical protein
MHRSLPWLRHMLQDVVAVQPLADQELGTVAWPNDADFDSDVLYVKVTAGPIPEYVTANKAR